MAYPANTYPTSIQNTTEPIGSDDQGVFDHAGLETFQNESIETLKAKVGADSSAVNTSHDYKLSEVATGEKAVSKTAVQTLTNKTLTAPVINGATGTGGTFTGAVKSSSVSGGIGYATGAGGSITQQTSKSTAVSIDKISGEIVMNAAALNAGVSVQFTVNNTSIAAGDVVILNIASGASASSYQATIDAVAANSFKINLRNFTGGNLSEAVVLNFAIIKAVKV